MSDFDYGKLSRQQKLAIFLIIIGPESAAEVLRPFDDADVEAICREMSAFAVIPAEVQRSAIEEFSPLVAKSASSALGGLTFAQRTLAIAKGEQKASSIVGRIAPAGGTAVDVLKGVSEMEGRQIFNLVRNEQPQTISFLLSHLEATKAAEIFALLPVEVREEVVERLGTLESTPVELVAKIVRSLGRHCDAKARPTMRRSDGVRVVADLLNQIDKEESKNLLARIEERNSTLGAAVRKKLFSFEDLNRLQPADLQRALREIESSNLALAMKSASTALRERIYAAISKRAAEGLKEELEMLGAVKLKDVETAQDAIIQVVRRLEEEGQITLDTAGAQSVVA